MEKIVAVLGTIFVMACGGTTISGVSSDVQWGALISSEEIDTRISVMDELGVGYARTSTTLVGYTGKLGDVEKLQAAGYKVLLNVSYQPQTDGSPRKFPTDMNDYKTRLSEVLDQYKPEVVVIENEPTNQQYYVDDMQNYLTELSAAIEVGHARGIKIADGCLHVTAVDAVSKGQLSGDIAQRQSELLEGYAKLDLDYVNLHMAVGTKGLGEDSDTFPAGLLKSVSDYIKETTGHDVIANEISLHTQSTSLVNSMLKELAETNNANTQFKYAIMYSGNKSSDDAQPLNSGDDLTNLGVTYRDSIH